MISKKRAKNIQAAGYNGARTVKVIYYLASKTLHRALGTLFCLNILLLSSLLLLLYSLKRVLLQRVCSLATLLWLNQGRFEIIRFYFVALTEGGTYPQLPR